MTQNNFTVNGSGNFGTPSNWSLGHVPTNTEDAEIDSTGGVAVATGAEFVNSIGTFADDGLIIDDGGEFTAYNGTGPNANDGSISVVDSYLFLGNGTFDNPGTVDLAGVTGNDVGNLAIEGTVTLNGGGTIEMSIGAEGQAGPGDNFIIGDNVSTTPTLVNVDDTISGDGTVEGLNFTNGTDGLIQTNNNSSTNGGLMQIVGDSTAEGGSFTNNGTMLINSGGEFLFGQNHNTSVILNYGNIVFQADDQFTTLAITGDVIIGVQQTGMGTISMEGQTPNDDRIITLGQPTQLTLEFQTLDGSGTIGDSDLSLVIEGGTIEADQLNQLLILNTGTNLIDNGGTLSALSGGDLDIDSPVQNSGTISVSGFDSVVALNAAVTTAGTLVVDTSGTLDVNASVAGRFDFTGPDATIKLGSGGSLQGTIFGVQGSDALDVTAVAFVSGIHTVWQQNGSTGTLSLVNGGGATLASFTLSGQYVSGDFSATTDGSGGTSIEMLNPPPPPGTTADMIMSNSSDGDYEIYNIGGNAVLAAYALGQVSTSLTFVGLGTFQIGDAADMLLRNSGTGAFDAYYINDNSITGSALIGTVGTNFGFAGIGDFDGGSSLSELLLRNAVSGSFELYQVAGGGVLSGSAAGAVGNNFSVKGFGEFSGSPETQMMMQGNSGVTLGQLELYTYQPNTASFTGIDVGEVGSNLSIVGCADLLGNGMTQMVMQQNNGDFWLYSYSASTNSLSGSLVGAIGSNFHVVGFGPLDTAGQDEMLMQDAAGDFEVYKYNPSENAFDGSSMGAVGPAWAVDGVAAGSPGGGVSAASTAQLVQAMASMGMSGASVSAPVPALGLTGQSQQTLLAPAPHA